MTPLSAENFDQIILVGKQPALICFTATWCRPSILQSRVLEKIREDYESRVLVETFDVDADEALADRFEIKTLPTTILFGNGEIVEGLIGFQQDDFLRSYLDHILSYLDHQEKDQTPGQE